MYIHYLKSIESWIHRNPSKSKGIPESQISSLETKIGKTLPQAYKEFLYLAGQNFYPIMRIGYSIEWLEKEVWPNEKKWFKEGNIQLEKDHLVIAEGEGAAYFFYFDEGDNPPLYIIEFDYYEDDPNDALRKLHANFSDFIERQLVIAKDMKRI